MKIYIQKSEWKYVENNYITDTGVGTIHLAGCTVEVIGGSTSEYTIRIHTAPTAFISGAVPNADFVYVNHGSGYSPKWHKICNTDNKPSPADIGAAESSHTHSYLPLAGGTCTGAVTAPDFIISSDINLKSGLTKIDNALSKICAITGYEYEKIVDPANPSIKKREVGIIAQDVQKIEPSAVSELEFNTGDKYLGVSPTAIIALLIESVKDLKAQVDELKNNLIWSNK